MADDMNASDLYRCRQRQLAQSLASLHRECLDHVELREAVLAAAQRLRAFVAETPLAELQAQRGTNRLRQEIEAFKNRLASLLVGLRDTGQISRLRAEAEALVGRANATHSTRICWGIESTPVDPRPSAQTGR